MSKAAQLAALIGSGQAQGDKNLIINGGMAVSQRGSVNTSDGNTVFGLDRMAVFLRGGPAATITQDTDVPSGQGFGYSNKIDVTTGDALGTANDFCLFRQKIEGQNLQQLKKGTSSAESVTLSFWIKSTITGTYVLEIRDQTNTRDIHKTYTVSSSNTWEYKTLTFEGDTTGAIDNDNTSGFEVSWMLGQGTDYTSGTLNTTWASAVNANRAVGQVNAVSSASNNILITGIQLEIGDVATPFEHESYAKTLQKCLRYFFRATSGGDGQIATFGAGVAYASNSYLGEYTTPVPMRAQPSIASNVTSNVSKGQIVLGGVAKAFSSPVVTGNGHVMRVNMTMSGATQGQGAYIQLMYGSSTDGNIDLSAEL